MKKILLSLVAMAILSTSAVAQNMAQMCGTTDWQLIDARLVENIRAADAGWYNAERSMAKYIPVKFHLIAKKDGTGRLSEAKVFENLCQLNKDYQDQSIIFYLADGTFSYIDDDGAYANQKPALTANLLNSKRHAKAINVYCAGATPSGGALGTTLAYYDPQKDWLCTRNDQVDNISGTLSHEFGHYFSLKHVFSGWDSKPFLEQYSASNNWATIPNWFKVTQSLATDGITPIECFNGSNCKTAGDRMCDTPADYNFGFGWNACSVFNKKLIGPCAADSIKNTDEENFMGYFLGCANYHFSQEQKNAILADYNSTRRTYIRSNYTPAIETLPNHVTGHSPKSVKTEFYNHVTLDWDDVPNADAYFVEVSETAAFSTNPQRYITKTSNFTLTNKLLANKGYYWRVLPFDTEGGVCLTAAGATRINFTTSSVPVATNDIESLSRWEVSPNPVRQGNTLFVDVDVLSGFDANVALYNAIGQEVKSLGMKQIEEGHTRLSFDTNDLANGVYFVRFQSGKGTESKRVLIGE